MSNISNFDLYFFNNQYNDRLVWEEYVKNRHKNFYQCLNQQITVQGVKKATGRMSEFEINGRVNYLLKLPADTYTCHVDHSVVPYYNKKSFIDKYSYNTPIDLNTIIHDHTTFENMILCQIGSEFCFGIQMAEANDGCYLILRSNRNTGLSVEQIDKYISENARWSIYFQTQVDVYYAFKNKFVLFTGDIEGDYQYIPLNIFIELTDFDKPNETNKWIMYASCSHTDENIAVATDVTIVTRNFKECVKVRSEFITYICNNSTNCKCFIMNQYQKLDGRVHATNGSKTINMSINYSKNPIPVSNFFIYTYDTDNHLKTMLLPFTGSLEHPNIYTFELLLDDDEAIPENVYIEWMESTETQCNFDNIFKDLIETYGEDTFYEKFINKEFSDGVNNYTPTELSVYDVGEFQQFTTYPDMRAFRLDRFIETLKENPTRYKDFSNRLCALNRQTIRHVYHEDTSPEVFSRNVDSNRNEIHDVNNLFVFDEPMLYIQVYISKNVIPMALIFVNGVRVQTQRIHITDGYAYIYIKRSDLRTDIKNTIDIEVTLLDSRLKEKYETNVTFYTTNLATVAGDLQDFGKLAVKDLMFIDKRTNNYIDSSEIGYEYALTSTQLANPTGEENNYFFDEDDYDFFVTNAGKYLLDENENYLAVRKTELLKPCPSNSCKLLNMKKLFLVLNASYRLNKPITITNTNNYRKLYLDDGLKSSNIIMKAFKEKPDVNRFRVYYGGKLLMPEDYTISLPVSYGGDVTVTIQNISSLDNNREVIIEYLPIDETVIIDEVPDADIYHDGLFWFTSVKYPMLIDEMKVYINGIRIPSSKIKDVGGINVFHIADYTAGDRLKIFYKLNDEYDVYEISDSKLVINDELKVNSTFREYMINN